MGKLRKVMVLLFLAGLVVLTVAVPASALIDDQLNACWTNGGEGGKCTP